VAAKNSVLFLIILILTLILFAADLTAGSVYIPFKDIIRLIFSGNDQSSEWITLHYFRLPRVITTIIAGISLSVSGLQMQTVFRNPLAGPYVLGISSGASLGVALVVIGFGSFFGSNIFNIATGWLLIIAAWTGSAAVLLVILLVSLKMKDVMTILILGIMLGSGISAIISILQFFSAESALKAFVIWTMGSVSGVSKEQIPLLLAGFIPGLLLSFLIIKPSNAILLGEDYAKTLGVRIHLYRAVLFISTSFLTGTVTAFCGPIAFIGIAVPHICRMIFRTSKQGVLLAACILAGASIMLLSDIISQLPGSQLLLPINAVTSLIGIPVVIWIILGKKRFVYE
jgi:iron complex transport system permease protein